MVVAYDGAGYHGFAENPLVATIAGTLRRSLERVFQTAVVVTGAGRTDTGVHAWGQVVSIDVADYVDLDRLARSLNSMCGPAIVVRSIGWAPDDFDARFSAIWRLYRYTVVNTVAPSPFLSTTAWHVEEPLDVASLELACDPFIGTHDFSSFCRRPRGQIDPVMHRRVLDARWCDVGDGVLRFEIRASAFCHQMVRSIVGTMVDAGRGKLHAGDIMAILRAKDRSLAGTVAPAHGLCLWEVGYQ